MQLAHNLLTHTNTQSGRRGTWWHPPSLCVAGMALMALGWLWRRHRVPRWRRGRRGRRGFLRSRRGTDGAGLALVARWVPRWRRGRRGFLRGRRGTWWHPPSLCVAGVALGDIDRHFAWQAWQWWHWDGSGGAIGSQITPHTHNLLTHNLLPHNLSTHNLSTHNLSSHNLSSHATCSQTTCSHTTGPHTICPRTQLTHTQLAHTRFLVAHTNPSPSLFSFLDLPCHLYLSIAACWKKLTCGVIRSFNYPVCAGHRRESHITPNRMILFSASASCPATTSFQWARQIGCQCKFVGLERSCSAWHNKNK